MSTSPLRRLSALGQSVWLDFIQRSLIEDGRLEGMIREHALAGMTSNPAIFEKAIGASGEYDAQIRALAQAGLDAEQIYLELALSDVRAAADAFREVYEDSGGRDGLVSLEVSPHLAADTAGTVAQARFLWEALDRPNAMIKVPGTVQGLQAITELTAAGINVNVTLLFSVERYRRVLEAYMLGLEERVKQGRSMDQIASVASFFVSRVDSAVDRMLAERGAPPELFGRAAIANAKLAYRHFLEATEHERWLTLFAGRAKRQRLLWASTSTKNPDYPDTLYVEQLIGPCTVNTMPPATLEAYLAHGEPERRLTAGLDAAREHVARLGALGIDLEAVAEQLEREGVEAFVAPFDKLLATIDEKRRAVLG